MKKVIAVLIAGLLVLALSFAIRGARAVREDVIDAGVYTTIKGPFFLNDIPSPWGDQPRRKMMRVTLDTYRTYDVELDPFGAESRAYGEIVARGGKVYAQ